VVLVFFSFFLCLLPFFVLFKGLAGELSKDKNTRQVFRRTNIVE
jgi:hypothetical protein